MAVNVLKVIFYLSILCEVLLYFYYWCFKSS